MISLPPPSFREPAEKCFSAHFNNRDRYSSAWRLFWRPPRGTDLCIRLALRRFQRPLAFSILAERPHRNKQVARSCSRWRDIPVRRQEHLACRCRAPIPRESISSNFPCRALLPSACRDRWLQRTNYRVSSEVSRFGSTERVKAKNWSPVLTIRTDQAEGSRRHQLLIAQEGRAPDQAGSASHSAHRIRRSSSPTLTKTKAASSRPVFEPTNMAGTPYASLMIAVFAIPIPAKRPASRCLHVN